MKDNNIWIRDTSPKTYHRQFELDYDIEQNKIKSVDLSKYHVNYINNSAFSTIMFLNEIGEVEMQWVYSSEESLLKELEQMKLALNQKK